MRKNYFQNVKIADKLKMVMKAIFAILLVNNILFAILMLVFGHPVWIIIPVIAVVGMPLLSKMIIQELTELHVGSFACHADSVYPEYASFCCNRRTGDSRGTVLGQGQYQNAG